MGIVNRRNAVMGWAVWQVGKRVAQQKAKAAVPKVDREKKRPNKTAIAAGVAAVAGLVLFWRKKGDGDEPPPPPPPPA